MTMNMKLVSKLKSFILKEIYTLLGSPFFFPCKSTRLLSKIQINLDTNKTCSILERTSALVLELVKREEELKHAKSKVC